MPEVIVLKHGKCAGTECSINSFGATVVSWKVDGAENIFVSSMAKTDGTKASKEFLWDPPFFFCSIAGSGITPLVNHFCFSRSLSVG